MTDVTARSKHSLQHTRICPTGRWSAARQRAALGKHLLAELASEDIVNSFHGCGSSTQVQACASLVRVKDFVDDLVQKFRDLLVGILGAFLLRGTKIGADLCVEKVLEHFAVRRIGLGDRRLNLPDDAFALDTEGVGRRCGSCKCVPRLQLR